MNSPLTPDERLKAANDILNTDDAFESDSVVIDMANGRDVSQREYRLAKVVSSLYKIIHPAFGCGHRDWDDENENRTVAACLSIDCPERLSVCCNAISEAISGDEGTGYFACSSCKAEYIGGECNVRI